VEGASAEDLDSSRLRSGPVSILLVDDDRETARALARSLTAFGHEVTTFHEGEQAIAALDHQVFDVVLSDIGMPHITGFDLLDAVRRRDEHIPVVLLTGDPTVSSAAQALEVGAFRYVTKPVELPKLMTVVEKAAKLYRMALAEQQAALFLDGQVSVDAELATLHRTFDRCMSQLYLAYQPIVDVTQRRIFGYEGLMRSREAELPHPGAVLDAAERLDRVLELGGKIRGLIAQDLRDAPPDAVLFVNLHLRDLLDDDLLTQTSPLTPYSTRVVLEVTERANLTEVPGVGQRIALLREMGFRIAVDDLGAGYAGLSSFALLEPEIVKLDMSLVRNIHLSETKTKIVRSMINLAKDMGIQVVGEGVEVAAEADALVELGCDLLQGYYYGKPTDPFSGVNF
jgi:EAL domain-containing protein (putative c-di-GMP-specific phosphodiesterase class I)